MPVPLVLAKSLVSMRLKGRERERFIWYSEVREPAWTARRTYHSKIARKSFAPSHRRICRYTRKQNAIFELRFFQVFSSPRRSRFYNTVRIFSPFKAFHPTFFSLPPMYSSTPFKVRSTILAIQALRSSGDLTFLFSDVFPFESRHSRLSSLLWKVTARPQLEVLLPCIALHSSQQQRVSSVRSLPRHLSTLFHTLSHPPFTLWFS